MKTTADPRTRWVWTAWVHLYTAVLRQWKLQDHTVRGWLNPRPQNLGTEGQPDGTHASTLLFPVRSSVFSPRKTGGRREAALLSCHRPEPGLLCDPREDTGAAGEANPQCSLARLPSSRCAPADYGLHAATSTNLLWAPTSFKKNTMFEFYFETDHIGKRQKDPLVSFPFPEILTVSPLTSYCCPFKSEHWFRTTSGAQR